MGRLIILHPIPFLHPERPTLTPLCNRHQAGSLATTRFQRAIPPFIPPFITPLQPETPCTATSARCTDPAGDGCFLAAAMAKSGGAKQPPWQAQLDSGVPLRLMNSLTRKPEVFVPRSGGRHVRWYSCGPTVYDASHMGHARSYITFDILRRILQDYFMYDVEFVMNITDVDDKIIMKARQHYLYEQYVAGKPDPATVTTDAKDAVGEYGPWARTRAGCFVVLANPTRTPQYKSQRCRTEHGVSSLTPPATRRWNLRTPRPCPWADALTKKLEGMTVADEKYGLYTKQLATVEAGLTKLQASASEEALQGLLTSAKDQLSGVLDKRHGSTVKDHSIFTKLTVHWEKEYFKDMRALNVLPPDILTRVTEYVEEIIAFVQKIADNGFAYESNGSVYFNTPKFATCGHHDYAKLVPEAVGDAAALADGEGALATEGEKKSSRDFALWKKSKPGEPAWSSPWGEGRPGWHIECSAMAADAFGELLDIHTGGVDLKFPHHDNEIAQSEAYYGCAQWTNYFLHSGHLNIEGLKMSKSLKNFITIQV